MLRGQKHRRALLGMIGFETRSHMAIAEVA
jgi:hypothetical protein